MTTRKRLAPAAFAVLCALAALAPSASATVTAKLRVLTPDRVLDPGTTYIVDEGVTVPTRADADCFGPPGGSGAEFTYEKPNALSLLATAGRTHQAGRPARGSPTSSASGSGSAGSAAPRPARARASGTSRPTTRRPRSAPTSSRSTTATRSSSTSPRTTSRTRTRPSSSSAPRPARRPGDPFPVTALEHKCVTDPDTFVTSCTSGPAAGVTISGADAPATTGADGTAQLSVGSVGEATVARPAAPTSRPRRSHVCVGPELELVPDAARRPRRRQPAGRPDQGHRPATTRSARAAATTRSTFARVAPTRSTAARATTRCGSSASSPTTGS